MTLKSIILERDRTENMSGVVGFGSHFWMPVLRGAGNGSKHMTSEESRIKAVGRKILLAIRD